MEAPTTFSSMDLDMATLTLRNSNVQRNHARKYILRTHMGTSEWAGAAAAALGTELLRPSYPKLGEEAPKLKKKKEHTWEFMTPTDALHCQVGQTESAEP